MIDEDLLRMSVLVTHLDEVDYYALLEIPRDASSDDVRDAFHAFALRFHPDRHVGDAKHQKQAHAIFKRGAEAYRVLMQPTLRARYEEARATGLVRLPPEAMRPESAPAASAVPPGARVFYDKAREALARGDLGGAKMHLALAAARGDSPLFDRLAGEIKAATDAAKR
ncbi:MAG: DnaJ domain-containing protein [Deltaproteobacteria bacterium]